MGFLGPAIPSNFGYNSRMDEPPPKPLAWIGSSRKDYAEFPAAVRKSVGYALYLAQIGEKSPHAKPLAGFGGAGVLEIVESFDGDAYRAVYTLKFAGRVYALHVFQKKSRQGIATPRQEMNIVRARLTQAQAEHEAWLAREKRDER